MRRFLTGNTELILCCVFYLAWWVIAFKPVGAVKGMKSGWLLIPAAILGIAAVFTIAGGIAATDTSLQLLPTMPIAAVGAAAYVILLLGTWFLMKRPVTTELFLIVGWATLACAEISALYAHDIYTAGAAWFFIALVIVLAAVSLVCYLLYYNLDAVKGYYDGIIPLAVVAMVTAVMNVTIALQI